MGEVLISAPWAIFVTLSATVALAEILGRLGWARKLGAAIIAILLGALLANLRVIPQASAGGPVYDPVFALVTPASIFLVLLEVNFRSLRRAGGPMIGAFLAGALGVALGVVLAFNLLPVRSALGDLAPPFAGMYAATYTGGAANFNAVALGYEVFGSGTEFVAALVVDNVMTNIWLLFLLALPLILARFPRFEVAGAEQAPAEEASEPFRPTSVALSLPIALAALAVFLSDYLAEQGSAGGVPVPSILILTTLALVVAHLPGVERLRLAQPLGVWGMLLFLACVGASADLAALVEAQELGLLLFGFVAVIFAVHLAVLLAWGWWRRVDPVVLAMASVTNIGGTTTAFVISEANRREDLLLPGILVGALGNALGTYVGFAVAGALGA